MRGLLLGAVMVVALVVGVLSSRPGGLRRQLRNAGRRLKLALVLAGVYLLVSAGLKLLLPSSAGAEWGTVGVAVILGIVFLVLGQDRPPAAPALPASPDGRGGTESGPQATRRKATPQRR